jgi:hypothetical protein
MFAVTNSSRAKKSEDSVGVQTHSQKKLETIPGFLKLKKSNIFIKWA